jgi:hypothetical protein
MAQVWHANPLPLPAIFTIWSNFLLFENPLLPQVQRHETDGIVQTMGQR